MRDIFFFVESQFWFIRYRPDTDVICCQNQKHLHCTQPICTVLNEGKSTSSSTTTKMITMGRKKRPIEGKSRREMWKVELEFACNSKRFIIDFVNKMYRLYVRVFSVQNQGSMCLSLFLLLLRFFTDTKILYSIRCLVYKRVPVDFLLSIKHIDFQRYKWITNMYGMNFYIIHPPSTPV